MKPDCNTPAARPVTKRVDWIVTIVPFLCILVLCALFGGSHGGDSGLGH